MLHKYTLWLPSRPDHGRTPGRKDTPFELSALAFGQFDGHPCFDALGAISE
jgi:hypothetical protein